MNSSAINILIVEDEAILAMDLADTLIDDNYRVVGTAQCGLSALQLFEQHPVDLLLCDIHLPGKMNGIQLVQQIKAIRPVPIVYLTSFTDAPTFNRAMETQPGAYLVKPYQLPSLRAAIDLAFHSFNQKKAIDYTPPSAQEPVVNRETVLEIDGFIFIKQEYTFVKIQSADILFVVADSNYIVIHLANIRYALRLSLSAFLEKVNVNKLIRTHRSYAVNIGQIDFFGDQEISIGKCIIPLSRQYRAHFLQRFNIR